MKRIPLPRLAAASASTVAALGATAVAGTTVATTVATTGAEQRPRNVYQASPARQPSAASVPDPADEHDHLRAARLQVRQVRMNRVPSARPAPQRDEARSSRTASRTPLIGSPREIARGMLAEHGWDGEQHACLDDLWERESGWEVHAENPSSGAYGIPQALPASKMAAAGPDWQDSAATQIRWGLDYIDDRYGTPCGAWDYWVSNNWY
ncbi:MAG: hypothetical protein ACRDPK_05960 [Carbonactinosporaceae bacterium]